MPRGVARFRATALCGCLTLALLATAPAASGASSVASQATGGGLGRVATSAGAAPGIDPAYIYSQLEYLVTHFQRREAGYRAGSAGHLGFARYWQRQMLRLLGQFGATAHTYRFPLRGWLGRPATAPAADVEVTVPGLADPAREVVIGCHYDGEADSTESAYDDASGCAIELGVARAMAAFWREQHRYPARTLRFVIFDAEEQGLFGSFDYVNRVARNDLRNISAMINEEQNGIAYPVRYLGRASNALMPFFAYLSPLAGNRVYPRYAPTSGQRAGLRQWRALMHRAVAASFLRFRAMGDQMLTYHTGSGSAVWRAVFTHAQLSRVRVLADTLGSSDQVPFTTAGIRSATFVGNATYYQRHPPAGSYPYDRPQDTLELMNTFADGGSARSHALELALGLPGMLTTWLLSQPAVLGLARPDGRPAAAIGDVGVILPGRSAAFSADAIDPGLAGAQLRYTWSFGDGQSAAGRTVRHTYQASGRYTLRLSVAGHGRPHVISRPLFVGAQPAVKNRYATLPRAAPGSFGYLAEKGLPPGNPAVVLPAAMTGARDQVGTTQYVRQLTHLVHRPPAPSAGAGAATWALAGVGAVLALAGLVAVARRRTTLPRKAGERRLRR